MILQKKPLKNDREDEMYSVKRNISKFFVFHSGLCMIDYRLIIFTTSRINSGVVPQHPPTIPAPASTRALI